MWEKVPCSLDKAEFTTYLSPQWQMASDLNLEKNMSIPFVTCFTMIAHETSGGVCDTDLKLLENYALAILRNEEICWGLQQRLFTKYYNNNIYIYIASACPCVICASLGINL
ncbi:hypothetical protein CEXT_259211 [Caerostris extrusa]|uniref:CMP/dCMP-type deaminase domain-containing protein n=1 Tax=Caerostris extrusa TaxID=172846 RepID=A0AAV4PDT4_CAEEX|nr:hypothetical protein CEXT_259211 [Caerostris extrusa]